MRRNAFTYLLGLSVLVAAGCGGSGSTALGLDSNPRVRFVNAISSPTSANITLDDQVIGTGSAFGFVSDYQVFKNGNHTTRFTDPTTSGALVETTDLYELNGYYSTIAYGDTSGNYHTMVLSEKPGTSTDGVKLRVVNASSLAASTPVDVYITAPNADIIAATPTESNVAAGDTSVNYTDFAIGTAASTTLQVRITAVGSKIPLATTSVSLNAHESDTVVVTSSNGTTGLLVLPKRAF